MIENNPYLIQALCTASQFTIQLFWLCPLAPGRRSFCASDGHMDIPSPWCHPDWRVEKSVISWVFTAVWSLTEVVLSAVHCECVYIYVSAGVGVHGVGGGGVLLSTQQHDGQGWSCSRSCRSSSQEVLFAVVRQRSSAKSCMQAVESQWYSSLSSHISEGSYRMDVGTKLSIMPNVESGEDVLEGVSFPSVMQEVEALVISLY